jgi:hypothetical protein
MRGCGVEGVDSCSLLSVEEGIGEGDSEFLLHFLLTLLFI